MKAWCDIKEVRSKESWETEERRDHAAQSSIRPCVWTQRHTYANVLHQHWSARILGDTQQWRSSTNWLSEPQGKLNQWVQVENLSTVFLRAKNKVNSLSGQGHICPTVVQSLIEDVRYFIKGFLAHFPGVNLALWQLLCDYVLVSLCCGLTEWRWFDNQCDRAVEADFTYQSVWGPDSFQAHTEMQRSSCEIESRDCSLIKSVLPRAVCI